MFISCSTSAANDAATLAAANEYTDGKLAAGVAPSGAAGGDLSGSYPNPTLKAAAVVDAVEAGIAADTGAQAAIAAAIADDIVGTGAFQAALAAAAPNLKTCAGAAMAAGANVPTCDEMDAAIAAGVASATIPDATDTVKGKVELATTAEATAGTSTTLAVTPAGVAAAIAAAPAATPTAQAMADAIAADAGAQTTLAGSLVDNLGATPAETIAGVIDNKLVSPSDMSAALQDGANYGIHTSGWIANNGPTIVPGEGNSTEGYLLFPGGTVIASRTDNISFGANRNGSDGATMTFRKDSNIVGAVDVTATGTTYTTISDHRLKTVDGPVKNSGKFIDALKPVTGEWKASPGKKANFFLAHEVQAVSPSSVHGEKDAVDADGNPVMQSMEYGSADFIVNMVAELQDLRKRVKELEAK